MIKDYEDFKKFILSLTTIDLNAYKEKQMKRRIDTLIARHKYDGYDSYCKAIKEDTGLREEFVNYITIWTQPIVPSARIYILIPISWISTSSQYSHK